MKLFTCILIFSISLPWCENTCTDFPSVFDGSWYDSQFHSTGLITFSQSQKKVTAGWSITVYGVVQTDFTCVLSSSSGLLVFQGSATANAFGIDVIVLVCISITKKTDNSYMYYRRGGLINDVRASATETLGSSTSTYCTGSANTEDFGILVKDGQYGNVAISLPNPFLGIYNYTFTNDGTTFKCSSTSVMDGCTDKTLVQLNRTLCSDELLDADNGRLHVVACVLSGSTYYIATMHSDAVATHRSTCVTATISGTTVTASTHPGSCNVGQTSSARTSHADSVLITMEPYEICYSAPGSSSSYTSVPATVVLSFIIAIAINNGYATDWGDSTST